MANPLKGDVEFTALGQSWRAVLDTEAKIGVEDAYGKGFVSIIMDALGEDAADEAAPGPDATAEERRAYLSRKFQRMRIGYARTILFEATRRHHPDLRREQAAAMIDDMGEAGVAVLLTSLIDRSRHRGDGADPDASAEGKASPAPKRSKGRTGRRA